MSRHVKEAISLMSGYEALFDSMRGGIGIAAMVKVTDGAFCGDYGKGSAMVQIGGYGADGYKGDGDRIVEFLRPQVREARRSGARVVVNTAGTDMACLLAFAKAFEEVGGDAIEYNAHTGLKSYVRRGLGYAQFAPEHQESLFEVTRGLSDALSIPLIVKGRAWTPSASGSVRRIAEDYGRMAQELARCGAASMHLNLRKEDEERYDTDVLREIKEASDLFLIASGYVGLREDGRVDLDKAVSDAEIMFEAGADLVLIGQAAMDEPGMVEQLAERLVGRRA